MQIRKIAVTAIALFAGTTFALAATRDDAVAMVKKAAKPEVSRARRHRLTVWRNR